MLAATRSSAAPAADGPAEEGRPDKTQQKATLRAVLPASLTIFATYTAICFLEVSLPLVWVAASDPWVYLTTSIAAIALILLIIDHSVRVDAARVYRWAMPLLTCGLAFALAGVQALGVLSYFISRTCSMMLEILLGLYFLTLVHRGRIGGCLAGGLYFGSCQLGVLVGNALVLAPAQADPAKWTLWCTLGCICLLAVASLALPWLSDEAPRSERAVRASSAPAAIEGFDPSVSVAPASRAPISDAALDARAHHLAARCGLSAREVEVLGYLARGRSQPYIREELMLSKNTVSSHVKHIYAKLGVHSKQELIDLVERESTNGTGSFVS